MLCFMLTACNDDFLDVDPVDRYSDAVVWTDESLITSFVNNIYEGQKWGFHTVMLSSLCDESMEVWAWESQPVVMSELSPSYQGILAPNFWIITFHNITWTNLYKNIRACNIFFENAEKYALEGDVVDKLKGEVHYLRAYFYYWLLSQWGGIPLIEKSFTPSDDLLVARNTFEETVDFIVKDLDEAASILPLNGDKARATKGAAMALKARGTVVERYGDLVACDPGGRRAVNRCAGFAGSRVLGDGHLNIFPQVLRSGNAVVLAACTHADCGKSRYNQ